MGTLVREVEPRKELTLPWLRALRWTAVVGQTATVLAVRYGLGIPLPLAEVFGVIALIAASNLALHSVPRGACEEDPILAAILLTDVGLLTVMLQLTGGSHNPFATLYLVHGALAAVALAPRWASLVAASCCAGYGVLFFGHDLLPRPGDPVCGVGPNLPMTVHLRGMWISFALTVALVVIFAGRLQAVLRRRDVELTAARELALQHERFAGLATLAAGAAHELGTPLGSIALAAGELERTARREGADPALIEDARLIHGEAIRCRSILDRLQEHADDVPQPIPLATILRDLALRFRGRPVQFPEPPATALVMAPPAALGQAMANLVSNAVEAAPPGTWVSVEAEVVSGHARLRVTDRGAGIPEAVRQRAGEPFFTTKPPDRGMGLGLFLVRLLARRMAGEFTLETPPGGGTCACLSLPVHSSGSGRMA
ncbi:MAG: HAMP domain-containing histidine kinase [Verrucomicrobiales bacterium]|nr:HAMP domain-containing histidine kinase [Verrucomicrobiales bacterium]